MNQGSERTVTVNGVRLTESQVRQAVQQLDTPPLPLSKQWPPWKRLRTRDGVEVTVYRKPEIIACYNTTDHTVYGFSQYDQLEPV